MKKTYAMIMVLVLMLTVSGCGKKEIDYVGNNVASDTDSNSVTDEAEAGMGISSGSFSEQIGAPERWEGEYQGNNSGMTGIDVLADVNLDGVSGVNVYHTVGVKLTEEYKKNFVETLSEGIIYNYDDEMLPKPYWQDLIECQQNEIDQAEDGMAMNPDDYDESYVNGLYATLREYQEKYDAAPDDYMAASDFTGNAYKITYLGMDFLVLFNADDDSYVTDISLQLMDTRDMLGDDVEAQDFGFEWVGRDQIGTYTMGEFSYQPGNNGYAREQDQLEQEVQTFLNGLGITGFSMAQNFNIEFYTGPYEERESIGRDGCGMVLFKCMDGLYLCGQEYEPETYTSQEISLTYNRDRLERIELSINDKGVFGMTYYFPMEWTVQTENVEILSFDTIQAYLLQYAQELDTLHPTYTNIDLIYCIYSESTGSHEFMVVPAWRFYSNVSKRQFKYEIMANAIDGSRIDIEE